MRTEAQNKLDSVVAFLFLLGWAFGVVMAKGVTLKVVALACFPYAFYTLGEIVLNSLK
jgi:hypothetical protein